MISFIDQVRLKFEVIKNLAQLFSNIFEWIIVIFLGLVSFANVDLLAFSL